MKRLFIAVDFNSSVIEQIQNISYGVKNARWMPADQIHLTLRFIGDCDEERFTKILSVLQQIECRTFCIDLKGVGYFPPRGKPNVLWVGIKESLELRSLFNTIQHTLYKAGIPREGRKFHPHITVARIKNRIKSSDVIPFLTQNSLFQVEQIPVIRFHLYSSALKPTGAVHTIEETYHLL